MSFPHPWFGPFEAPPDECETPQFIARLLLRDEVAWTRFIERFQRLIHARVLAAGRELGRSPASGWVEEACAEVLAALFRNDLAVLRRFEGRCRFSTWLSVVARRVALAHIVREDAVARRHRPPRSDFDLDAVAGPASPRANMSRTTHPPRSNMTGIARRTSCVRDWLASATRIARCWNVTTSTDSATRHSPPNWGSQSTPWEPS